jgi:DNA-binding helix-hairpin-helix protein with protein kinase domain
MKTRTLLLALFLFVSASVFAQSTPDEKAKALTDRQKTQLTLTDDQYKQVYDINLDFINKLGAVKEDGGGKMAKFKKLKELDKNRDASLQKVLTEEQFKKFQTVKQETREEMKEKYKESKNKG